LYRITGVLWQTLIEKTVTAIMGLSAHDLQSVISVYCKTYDHSVSYKVLAVISFVSGSDFLVARIDSFFFVDTGQSYYSISQGCLKISVR